MFVFLKGQSSLLVGVQHTCCMISLTNNPSFLLLSKHCQSLRLTPDREWRFSQCKRLKNKKKSSYLKFIQINIRSVYRHSKTQTCLRKQNKMDLTVIQKCPAIWIVTFVMWRSYNRKNSKEQEVSHSFRSDSGLLEVNVNIIS